MKKGNLVNLDEYRKKKASNSKAGSAEVEVAKRKAKPAINENSDKIDKTIVNMSDRRKEELTEERRELTRTVLSHFVGVFVMIPEKGLQPVSLYDISESGMAFDMPMELGKFEIGEAVVMRMYLSHDTYFSYNVKIANVRDVSGLGVYRHGTTIKKTDDSYKTLFFFMRFLEEVGKVARKDRGGRVMGRID